MHSFYSPLTLTLLTAPTALAALNIGCYSGIAGWRRNDVEKIYYQDAQSQIFQQTLDPNGGPAGNRTGPLPLGNYPAVFDSPLAVVQFANAQEVRLEILPCLVIIPVSVLPPTTSREPCTTPEPLVQVCPGHSSRPRQSHQKNTRKNKKKILRERRRIESTDIPLPPSPIDPPLLRLPLPLVPKHELDGNLRARLQRRGQHMVQRAPKPVQFLQ